MTGRITAIALDLSRLSAPTAIRDLDYEVILQARRERLVQLFNQADIAYDADRLESDSAMILQQTDAYRELLGLAAINDAVRSLLVSFAQGPDLDQLGANFGVARLPDESDSDFRRRVLLAPEAYSVAGTIAGYRFHALSADSGVADANVWSPAPGEVTVAVQSREGDGSASDDLVEIVRARLMRDDIKPLTDVVAVRSVDVVDYAIDVTVYLYPGPSPETIRQMVIRSIEAMAELRKSPMRDIPLSAIHAAAHVGPVDRVVIHQPLADVATDFGELGNLTDLTVKVAIYA